LPVPEASSQQPEARSQKPEARSQKPEARSQKPEARSQKPEARSQKPEARTGEANYRKTLAITINTSMRTLKKNTGTVTLVGIAARLVTRAIPMAMIAAINNTRFIPVNATAMTVKGVITQPCITSAIPTHKIRFSDCFYSSSETWLKKEY
jgi:uncharacterized membrane protein YdbT with pleckstrin-like domain